MSNNGAKPSAIHEDWGVLQVAESDEVGDSEVSAPTDDPPNSSSVSQLVEQQASSSSSDGDGRLPTMRDLVSDNVSQLASSAKLYFPTSPNASGKPDRQTHPSCAHSFKMFKNVKDNSEKLEKTSRESVAKKCKATFHAKPSDLCSDFVSKANISGDQSDPHKELEKEKKLEDEEKSMSEYSSSSSDYSALSDEDTDASCDLYARALRRDFNASSLRQYMREGQIYDEVPMIVDTTEDYWTRLQSVKVTGNVSFSSCFKFINRIKRLVSSIQDFLLLQLLEYVGRGKNIHDNGLAQSCVPLSPINHYFELKIIDPGENCYIAIGVARKVCRIKWHWIQFQNKDNAKVYVLNYD